MKVKLFLAVVVASMVVPLFAAKYYWKGVHYEATDFDESKGYGAWSSLSNWSTEGVDGADVTQLPGKNDSIYAPGENVWRQFDLEGKEWSIYGWKSNEDGGWYRHFWRFKNGTLNWTGKCTTRSDTVHLDEGAELIMTEDSYYCASDGHGAPDEWRVHSGAKFSMFGEFKIYNFNAEIDEGATMVFAPSNIYFRYNTWQHSYIHNSGDLFIPDDIIFTGGTQGGSFTIMQKAGTLTLGGALSKNGQDGTYKIELKGGTVRTTGDVSVDFTEARITGPIILDVEEGSLFDFSGFSADDGVVVTKTGDGDVVWGQASEVGTIKVSKGSVLLRKGGNDISNAVFEEGGKIKIGEAGTTLESWDDSISSASFVAVKNFSPLNGETVFTCADADILEAAADGLNATFPRGITVVKDGDSLVADVSYVFVSTTVSDMNDPQGWSGGNAGIAAQPVKIYGEGVNAVMNGQTPDYLRIDVEGNASLAVSATRNIPSIAFAAGTAFKVESDQEGNAAKVVAVGDFETKGDGEVTVYVGNGCVLDLSSAALSIAATLRKTGEGSIVFGETVPAKLKVESGAIALQPFVQYDINAFEMADDAVVEVVIDGVLKKGFPVVQPDGKTLYLWSGCYIGNGSWSDAENWVFSEIPSEPDVVCVYGKGASLALEGDGIAMPKSIEVKDGATLKVLSSLVLPPLVLDPEASMVIGDNEMKPEIEIVMNAAPNASARIAGENVSIPSFFISTNATLKFSTEAKLKNLDMVLCGKITTTEENAGSVVFGHALNGETSYFGLYADGATIHPLSNQRPDNTGHYVSPDQGGRVVQLRPYCFKDCKFPCSGWFDFTNPRIGINNPLDEPCEIIFDNTRFFYNQYVFVGSSAKIRCINGGSFEHQIGNADHIYVSGGPARIEDFASIELDGKESVFSCYGGGVKFAFNPSADAVMDIPTLTLKNGASIKGFHLEGNGNASLYIVNEGEWTIPRIFRYDDDDDLNFSPVLKGFDVAIVEENSVFRITGRNEGKTAHGNWLDWDRILAIDGEIGGYGDVLVSNAVVGNSMEITVTSPINSCEGAIRCDGANDCSLLFADGANWAGTVVAGNVSLTNLTDGATAARVDFAKLDLASDFPVRVWRGEDGKLASDRLDVGEYINNGGKIVPVMMTEDANFNIGDALFLGEMNAGSSLPKVVAGWNVRAVPVEGNGSKVLLTLKRGVGFSIFVL